MLRPRVGLTLVQAGNKSMGGGNQLELLFTRAEYGAKHVKPYRHLMECNNPVKKNHEKSLEDGEKKEA